ncbi:unnamed protein product [Ectocarpus fasciculatus]
MPDIDTPQISGILEEHAPPPPAAGGGGGGGGGGGVVGVQQASKRPRDDGSPVRGKRGRGENGDISLSLKIPVPATSLSSSVPSSSSPASPPWVPPLCESPSKINQAPSPFAPYSGGATAAKPPAPAADDAAAPVAGPGTAVPAATTRRKGRMPHAAPPSLGATDPIFHAALLRLLHSRNGDHCAEAVGWRWRGDTPARFDHWPCALHPSVMDLLACVSASEEQVVLTGCDKKHADSCNGGGDDPPPPRREAAWRAPRPRTPWAHRGGPPPLPGATTPIAAPSPLPPPASAQTPLSALRRSGSSRRLPSKNRVRFSTHDMSVVDTPDPQRGGSAKGMMSALGGLESILSAAERIRELAAGGPGNSGVSGVSGGGRERGGGGGRQYEGYFDRFSAAAGGDPDGGGGGDEQGATAASGLVAGGGLDNASSGSDGGSQDEGSAAAAAAAAAAEEGDDDVDDAPLETEARSVREDSAAFVTVLEEIANGDAAPGEVALAGGWGPEHRNAAAFYSKELAFLCGTEAGGGGGGAEVPPFVSGGGGAVGSHLRVRYLDVLSCLVRYNLKLLLNTCECEAPDEQQQQQQQQELDNMDDDDDDDDDDHEDEEEHDAHLPQQAEDTHDNGEGDDGDDDDNDVTDDDNDDDDSVPTANLPSPPSPTAAAALSVIVPGRATLLRQQGLLDAAWGSSVTAQATAERGLCGCVSVLDDKGAMEFNTEDVAALLTLALGRVHPFMPLAARITLAAKEAGWDGGGGDDGDEDLDARVWAAVQEYTLECRRAAAAASSAAAAAAASPTHLFSSPSVAAATPPLLPVAVCSGGSSAAKAGGPSAGDAADKLPSSGFAVKGGAGVAKEEAGNDGARALASPSVAGRSSVEENGSAAAAELELTVDESADLLEFVAAARFIAQLLAEPVVAAGVSEGRWSCAMRLSEQVRKLAEEEQQAQEAAAAAASRTAAAKTAPPTSSLSNMLCLGALADVQGLGLAMAQQARYAPALEAALKRELRQALRGGPGLKRRIKHRLQPPGAPDVFSFPMITPACQLVHYEGGVGCV